MTPEQLELARRRLWLGITNVGFWVLMAAMGLCGLDRYDTSGMGIRHLGPMFLAVLATQAVFDLVGGITLMPGPRPSVTTFLRRWSRGVFGHTLVLATVGIVSALSLRLTGGFGAGIVLTTTALVLGRRQLLRAVAGGLIVEQTRDGETIFTVALDDPAFTGGIVGLGRRGKSLLPPGG